MIKAIVIDIEGTTTSLSFVKDVLFPYSRKRLADFVHTHGRNSKVSTLLEDARKSVDVALNDEELIAQLLRWVDEDRKVTALKALQGLIWEEGYRRGDFTGHVYPDAVRRLQQWKAKDIPLFIFSSGSVQAQKLLFGHTEHGDLTPLFSGYFDTTLGAKREPDAYQKIAKQIGKNSNEILFLSDIKEELDAAHASGMKTCWVVRDKEIDASAAHRQVNSFDQITL